MAKEQNQVSSVVFNSEKAPSNRSLGLKHQFGLRKLVLLQRLLLTRLETRTKESITYASLRVQKLIGLMKVSSRCQD